MDSLEQRIRDRAYHIWEEEGRPHGREREHWQRARSEVMAVQNGEHVSDHDVASRRRKTSRAVKIEAKSKRGKTSKKAPEDRPRA